MESLGCPFHPECQFPNNVKRSPSYAMLEMAFCKSQYEECEIAQRILGGDPIPPGSCPDGSICK
jgi:hypothetical protein